MNILKEVSFEDLTDCPYINGKFSRNEYFVAQNVSKLELESLLSKGWRKFGPYYFRPKCPSCRKCIPIRVNVTDFKLSKSQKRVLNKNKDVSVKINDLDYCPKIYDLYKMHSKKRFDSDIMTERDFFLTHYTPSTNTFQVEYYLKSEMVGLGFLDFSSESLSSIYFIYNPDYKRRSLGIFSAIKEIELAKQWSLKHYYLGYFVEENHFMSYKAQFKPNSLYDWVKDCWVMQRVD